MKKTVVGQVAVGMLALGFGAISGCSGLPDEHPTLSGTSSSSSSAATSGAGGTSSTGAAGSTAASTSAIGTPATTSSSSTGAAGSTVSSGASGGAGGSGGSTGTGGAGGSGGGGTGGKAGGGGAGTGGSTGTGGARDGGSDATVSGDAGGGATFTAVSAIIATGCRMSGCHHSGTGAGVNNHIDLRADGLYARLMLDVTGAGGTAPEANCMRTMKLIVPNNPAMSLLLGMVGTNTAARMGCGARMPDRCGTAGYPACLTAAQVLTITNWIMAGAPNN